ncbi:MAG: hypothetical protein KGQ66_23295 [Acidobacteriota bacterium]|nr:hypothetical protein [Acidobacteriota bacterium]
MQGSWMERVMLLAAVVLPVAGGLSGRLGRRRAGVAVSWAAAASAVALLVVTAATGRTATVGGGTGAGLTGAPLSAFFLVLVTGVGAVVSSYASRYLQSDPTRDRFAGWVGVVVTAMAAVAAAASVAGLVAGWLVAGAAFSLVAGLRTDLPGVTACRRSLRRTLGLGDASLVAAAAIIWAAAGDASLSPASLTVAAGHLGAWRPVVASLVVVGALTRCAQAVFGKWLPLTVSAPTPACALLHAGVVNGGGMLLLRFGPLGVWGPAMVALLVAAGATAVAAAVAAAAQPDVKGQLAFSTMSQMGFMLAECAVGAYGAAALHLAGHGAYKASLFLSSGSTVTRPGRPTVASGSRSRGFVPALVAGAAAAAAAPGIAHGDGVVLTGFSAATALALAWGFFAGRDRAPAAGTRGLVWPAVLVGTAAGYGALVASVGRFVSGGLVGASSAPSVWWLGAVGGGGLLAAAAARSRRWGPAVRAWALDAAAAPPAAPLRKVSSDRAVTAWSLSPSAAVAA